MEKTSVDLDRSSASFTNSQSLDELYLQILTRRPTDWEKRICEDQSKSDIAFALLFGNEFFFSH